MMHVSNRHMELCLRGRRHRARERPGEPRQQSRGARGRGGRQIRLHLDRGDQRARGRGFRTRCAKTRTGRRSTIDAGPAHLDRRLFQRHRCDLRQYRKSRPASAGEQEPPPARRTRAAVAAPAAERNSREDACRPNASSFPMRAARSSSAVLDRPAGRAGRLRAVRALLHLRQGRAGGKAHRRRADRARHRGAALRFHRARRKRGRVRQHDVLLQRRRSGRGRGPPAHDVSARPRS